MKRTLPPRCELELSVRTPLGGGRFRCDLSGLSRAEQQLLLMVVTSAERAGVNFGLTRTDDERARIELTVGRPPTVNGAVAEALAEASG